MEDIARLPDAACSPKSVLMAFASTVSPASHLRILSPYHHFIAKVLLNLSDAEVNKHSFFTILGKSYNRHHNKPMQFIMLSM